MDFLSDTTIAASSVTVAETSRREQSVAVAVEKKPLIEEIREKGFRAFIEDMQAEKLTELREKILTRMGFSDEDLQGMSTERRAEIEQMVNREIMERMLAKAAVEGGSGYMMAYSETTHVQITQVSTASVIKGGEGMGPLLAQQELQVMDGPETPEKPTEKDEAAG